MDERLDFRRGTFDVASLAISRALFIVAASCFVLK